MKTQTSYQSIPPTPKEYWEDECWADDHINEIVKDHPNQWVAVVNKKVVAAAKTIAEVIRIAEEKMGAKNFPILFAEEGIHVYQNQLGTERGNSPLATIKKLVYYMSKKEGGD